MNTNTIDFKIPEQAFNALVQAVPQAKVFLFDMDGTIVDTENIVRGARLAALNSCGIDVEINTLEAYKGITSPNVFKDIISTLKTTLNNEEQNILLGQIMEAMHAEIKIRYQADIPRFENVISLVRYIHQIKLSQPEIKLGIVSNSNDRAMDILLPKLGFKEEDFDVVMTRTRALDTGFEVKPAPDMYQQALQQINQKSNTDYQPHQAISFEDSEAGMQASKAADMNSVFVLNPGDLTDTSSISNLYDYVLACKA